MNLTLAAALTTVVALPAVAQNQHTSAGVEEVIVTAQKREESLQDTPISILAFSTKALENRGIKAVTDLQTDVPGLIINEHPNSASTGRLIMRGIGQANDQITYDPKVSIYVDGVYMARFQGLSAETADLERIEVLRGPQGALYGRNSTGGAINFITKAPQLGSFNFRQDLTVGNRDRKYSRTRLNIPLGDTAAAELSYLRLTEDGYINNIGSGADRFGDKDRRGWRAALLWQPNDRLDLRYSFDRSEIEDTPVWMGQVPLYPVTAHRPKTGSASVKDLIPNDITGQGHNLTATFDINDSLQLKSITGYRELDNFTYMPYHPGVLGPDPVLVNIIDTHQRQFSQELQLIGTALDSRLQYVGGLFYFDESATSYDINQIPMSNMYIDRDTSADNTAYAVYGQATYTPAAFSQRLHLTVGARYSWDERKATRQVTTTVSGAATPAPREFGDRDFSEFSPNGVIAYDLTDDMNVYLKATKGYQTGGFNLTATTPQRFSAGFKPEFAESYELGLKSTWLDNRLRVNAALFTTDRKDMQVSVMDPVTPSLTDMLNAGKATVNGAEVDITARPIPALNLSLSYAWLDAHFDSIRNSVGDDVKSQFVYDQAPRHKASATAGYEWPHTSFGTPTASVTYNYLHKMVASYQRGLYIDTYGLLDARLSLTDIPVNGGNLRFSLWGKNLTDENYYTFHFSYIVPTAMFGAPRSYGLDVSLDF
ncbi:TonB-dependent receptor [Steroidobacter denitrificans]|uniref:TonB-dependent receptor n=2 Tax=Steroidobacter denitrificans TaxID=465721 RepID=A0A127F9B9_STEDE|nr:TonB-dependent receptor [Steroidobacter denitrificans]